MSNKYKNSEDIPNEVIAKRLDELSDAVVQRLKGDPKPFNSEFTCRIPCELDRDPDVVLSTAATRLRDFEQMLSLAKEENKSLESQMNELEMELENTTEECRLLNVRVAELIPSEVDKDE